MAKRKSAGIVDGYNIGRLRKLATFLKKVPPKKFDMHSWATDTCLKSNECGTTGCALGWATVVFPRLLKLGIERGTQDIVVRTRSGRKKTFQAAKAVFGTRGQEYDLFMPNYEMAPETPKQVARRIEDFCKEVQRGEHSEYEHTDNW